MDDKNKDVNMYIFGLYAILSFICVMITILLVHIACVKKYKLNWFEKNLLETADLTKNESNELQKSQELFVGKDDKNHGSSLAEISNSESNENIRSSCNSLNSNASVPIARSDKHVVLMAGSPVKPRIASMHGKLDLSQIDYSLYEKLSPDKEDDEDIRGSVHITLNYDSLSGILTVKLIEAQDLKARDFSGTADPYAKIRLLPDKTNVWQTKIHKKTLNPIFDEDFVFEVTPAQLHRNILEVLLFDFDAYSRHQNIGGVQIALESVDLDEKTDFWKTLGPVLHQDAHIHLGELLVSLAYLPSAERLTVVIVKARNLKVVDETRNSSDPYVKVCLVNGTKRLKKRKTSIYRNSVNPVFNEAITFDVEKETLYKSDIEFYIIHDSLLGVGELLGKSRIGFSDYCREEEKNFFTEILHNKTATAKWLTLLEAQ